MLIQKIQWQDALPIRHQVLWPDKPPAFCKIAEDPTANHYGAYVDDKLVCVASIYISDDSARLRKFATLPSFQKKGIGTQVISHIIKELQAIGINHFWCDARTSAVDFYQRFGLKVDGAVFEKSTIPYYKMVIDFYPNKN